MNSQPEGKHSMGAQPRSQMRNDLDGGSPEWGGGSPKGRKLGDCRNPHNYRMSRCLFIVVKKRLTKVETDRTKKFKGEKRGKKEVAD